MLAFFDTEFTGLHKDTTLISIGFKYESGHKFYAELTDYDQNQIDTWLQKNVIDLLILDEMLPNTIGYDEGGTTKYVKGDTAFVADQLNSWHEFLLKNDEQLEIWSDCLAYDWVLLNNLWGNALNIPKNIFYIPFDICTLFKLKGEDPDTNREEFVGLPSGNKHNALWDAEVIELCYEKLMKL